MKQLHRKCLLRRKARRRVTRAPYERGTLWRRTSLSQALDCVDPSTGEAFDTIANGDARDVDGAVNAARAALLRQIAAAILENREELAALETRDNGKPLAAVPQENL